MKRNEPTPMMSNSTRAMITCRDLLRRKEGLSASIGEVIGAITISIIVLALSGFGISAGINYSHDSNAEAALQSVRSAQILHQTKTDAYGTMDELQAGEAPSLRSAPDGVRLFVDTDGRDYCALVESGSMSRPQLVNGPRGGVATLRTRVNMDTIKGCHTDGRSVRMTKHVAEYLSIAEVPAGSTSTCLRFNIAAGPGVTHWVVGVAYLDAALMPVGNTKSPNPAGGFYTTNGRANTPDVDGYCIGIGPEVKNVRWNFLSGPASDRNGIGSTYRDVVITFQ